jgi:5-methylcytosine-specific restriction endonuclease McrA
MIASNTSVLVLNRFYQPVSVTRARRAFGLLYSGAARALDKEFQTFDYDSWATLSVEAGDDVLKTPRFELKIPRVVILQIYDKLPGYHVRFSRQNIYLRDGFTCQYCGHAFARAKLNLDHVVPKSQGGRTTWENVVCSCIECNLRKGGRTPYQAKISLKNKPVKPAWNKLTPLNGEIPYSEWVPFIDPTDASYWNAELSE